MAVDLLLADPHKPPPDDPLGRSWAGWSATGTDEQLWAANRGLWTLGRQVVSERFATLSYDGRIQVVVEITGRTRYDLNGQAKWALSGQVLLPGDPVHDQLKGSPAPRHRGPVAYFDTSSLELLPAGERARFAERERVTMIVTWNPERWNPDDWGARVYPYDVKQVATDGLLRSQWSTGSRTSGIEPGDRIFFLRQGVEPRGILGSGTATSRIFADLHWDEQRTDDANYVLIEWDTLLLPEDGLPHADLVEQIPEGGIWRPQSSGWVLPTRAAAKLETLWAHHLGLTTPAPARSAPRQRWQMDPVRRKKVEDAAQDRLMAHYRQLGWKVKDVRHGNNYDAVATKDGRTLWLEAKGTETSGATVIVTRGEVQWARNHPGDCVLGILSDVVFLPNGDIDPQSGLFRVFNWYPDGGTLEPRAFDFAPDTGDQEA